MKVLFQNFLKTNVLYVLSPISSVIVKKIGVKRIRQQRCGYINTKTSWGCTHKGTARIFNLKQDIYQDVVESESIRISNARGGTFLFFLNHYYNKRNEGYYDEGYKMVGTLIIKASNGLERTFSHSKLGQFNDDGTFIYEDQGKVTIKVNCDDNCNCKYKRKKQSVA